ncbi:glycosyltransferase family 2 protein [Klebsiella aerogenes]|uniref:glycosyltransferase family 2 protein n=1 Tax=Klebsiella aerogenes TaxID=548 RepID=UPI0035198E6C|nr:glycosyltransferase family 2 protein [Klebsiella aerogenes]
MKFYIAVPTYNGSSLWENTVKEIQKYAPKDTFVKVIDSGSTDDTAAIAKAAGFDVEVISSTEFNHGGTRNKIVDQYIDEYDVVIFLTQDAIPIEGFIENIINVFHNPDIVCAYGKQIPHLDANPIARHARDFNYPDINYESSKESASSLGLKSVFMSNSFSAYRLSAFKSLGGFPSNTILCEDMYFAAKALLNGYKSAYVSSAIVRHSHNYSPFEEFKRYFDIGVFHQDAPWIREQFGGASGEGKKFILSEFSYLCKNGFLWIPLACINNLMKLIGYKLGGNYKKIPLKVIRKISMHKRFWK